MSFTFAVDDVPPAAALRPTRRLAEVVGPHQALGAPAIPIIETDAIHPLLAAVHVAFAEHRPLVLTPDAVWLSIAQGVAQHVRLHAEALRPRLVRHAGRSTLTVEFVGVPSTADHWADIVSGLRGRLGDLVGDGRARLFTCDFSTTTPEAAVASEIVLMDVFAPYCAYEVACVCGIPEITLAGTPRDWRAIRDRIDVVAELDLGFWTRSLAPIADQLVATSEGRPDVAFWRDIYKPRRAYGWDRVTGWIARLFPYVGRGGRFDQRNPLLELALDEPRIPAGEGAHDGRPSPPSEWYTGPGVVHHDLPRGTSEVLIHLRDAGAGCGNGQVILEGGLLGVGQDDDGRLVPVAGWLGRPATGSTVALVARLRGEGHHVEPVREPRGRVEGPLEIVTLFNEVHAATLFPGAAAWRLRPVAEHEDVAVPLPSGRTFEVVRLVDMPDGTCLANARVHSGPRLVRLRIADLGPPEDARVMVGGIEAVRWDGRSLRPTEQVAASVPVLAGTLTTILDTALDGGGPEVLRESGETLLDIVPEWYLEPPPSLKTESAAEKNERRRQKKERQDLLRARLAASAPDVPPDPKRNR